MFPTGIQAKMNSKIKRETPAERRQRWRNELAERPEAWAMFHSHVIINLLPAVAQKTRMLARCQAGAHSTLRPPASAAELAMCVGILAPQSLFQLIRQHHARASGTALYAVVASGKRTNVHGRTLLANGWTNGTQ